MNTLLGFGRAGSVQQKLAIANFLNNTQGCMAPNGCGAPAIKENDMVEHRNDQDEKEWRCAAWYYVPSAVTCRVVARTADEAKDKMRLTMMGDPDFWRYQELDHDSASPVNIEVWNDGESWLQPISQRHCF